MVQVEEKLQEYYTSTDYVLLPYTPDFTASSGVLSYAAKFGKPIIATDHGLIGYKINRYRLGYTYRYDDIKSLRKILINISKDRGSQYELLSNNCSDYAANHRIEDHQNCIRAVLNNV